MKKLILILSFFCFAAFAQEEKVNVLYKYIAFDDLLSQMTNDQKTEIYLDDSCSEYYLNLLISSKNVREKDIKKFNGLRNQYKVQNLCRANSLIEIKEIVGLKKIVIYSSIVKNLEEGNLFLLPHYYQIYQSLDSFDDDLRFDEVNRQKIEDKILAYYSNESLKQKEKEEVSRQIRLKNYYESHTNYDGVVKYQDEGMNRDLIRTNSGKYVLKVNALELQRKEKEYKELLKERKALVPVALKRILSIYSRDNLSWNFVSQINMQNNKIVVNLEHLDFEKMTTTLKAKIEEINRIDLDVEKMNNFRSMYELYHSRDKKNEVDEEFYIASFFKKLPSGLIVYADNYSRANQAYLKILVNSQIVIKSKIKNLWISDKPNTYIIFDDGRYKEVFISDYFEDEFSKEYSVLEKYTWQLRKFHQAIFAKSYEGINQREAASVQMYTGALYNDINQCLRANNCSRSLNIKITNINKAISKLGKSGLKQITVYRGIENLPERIVKRLEAEDQNLVVDNGFQSTTTNAEIAKRFAKRKGAFEKNRLKNYLFVMKVKSCVSIEYLSYVQKEDEYLCPQGLRYRVKRHPILDNVYELTEN